jgi:hypothetical protein
MIKFIYVLGDKMTLPDMKIPYIRIILSNGFGDVTDITKSLKVDSMEEIYSALQNMLVGCGFTEATVKEWLPDDV